MGLLDRIKSVGSNLVESAKSAERAVEKAVAKTTESVSNAVSDGFDSARKAAVDLGSKVADSVIPSKVAAGTAQAAHSWYKDLNRAADTFGGAMRDAGALLEKGGSALGPFVPFANEAVLLGKGAQAVGQGIADAPEAAVSGADTLIKTAQDLEQKGEAFLDRARKTLGDGVKAAEEGLEAVGRGVKSIGTAVTDFVSEVGKATDYAHNIDALGPNDKYKLGVGGSLSVEGAKGYAKGSIEVARNEQGKYVVSVDGELGGGVYGEVGGKLGAKLNAEASATLGAGGKVEMTFDSPAQAKRATEILLKQAAASAAGAGANQVLPGVGGMAAQKLIGPSAEEMKFLSEHTSAVELRGNVAAEVAACAGLKDVAGLFGGAKVKDELAVRLELKGDDGKPKQPELVVKQTVSGELAGGAGLKLSGKQGSGGSAAFLGGKGEAKVSVEQRFTLPNVSGSDLLSDPLKTVSGAASSLQKSQKDKITLGLDLSGQGFGNGGGVEVTASYEGRFDALQAAAIDRLRQGDLSGALRTVDAGEAEVKVEPYTTLGVSLSPGVSVMGFGGGVELEATRKDVSDAHRFAKKGKPSALSEDLATALEPYLPLVGTGPVPRQLRG